MKHRTQLGNETDSHHVRAVDPKKLSRIELCYEAREGVTHQVHFSGRVDLDIVTGSGKPLNVVDRKKERPLRLAHQDLPRSGRAPWNSRQQASYPLLQVAVIRLSERGTNALDTAQEALPIERLQQVIDRLDLEGAYGILGVSGCKHDQWRCDVTEPVEDVEATACSELNVEINDIRNRRGNGGDTRLDGSGLGFHPEIGQLGKETPELRARRRLVLDNDDRVGHAATGNRTVATTPRGVRADRSKL